MDLPRILEVLAHELRSPAAVISGYARMLREGRLSEDHQADAFHRIEQAGDRVSLIGAQAAELARWLAPQTDPEAETAPQAMAIEALLARALAQVSNADRVSVEVLSPGPARVHAIDRDALIRAVGITIESVLSGVPDEPVRAVARGADAPFAWDILVAPASFLTAPATAVGPDGGEPLTSERGRANLPLIVTAAVIEAHGGRLWTSGGRRGMIGLRLLQGLDA
jgi:hypothetical protein